MSGYEKQYFYYQVNQDFYTSTEYKRIMREPDADMLFRYMHLLLNEFLNTEGMLVLNSGKADDKLIYTPEDLATDIPYTTAEHWKRALEYFRKIGILSDVPDPDGEIVPAIDPPHFEVGKRGASALRMRRLRENQRRAEEEQASQSDGTASQSDDEESRHIVTKTPSQSDVEPITITQNPKPIPDIPDKPYPNTTTTTNNQQLLTAEKQQPAVGVEGNNYLVQLLDTLDRSQRSMLTGYVQGYEHLEVLEHIAMLTLEAAPKNPFRYFKAILERYETEGITSREQAIESDKAHRSRSQGSTPAAKQNPALQYEQRPVPSEEDQWAGFETDPRAIWARMEREKAEREQEE